MFEIVLILLFLSELLLIPVLEAGRSSEEGASKPLRVREGSARVRVVVMYYCMRGVSVSDSVSQALFEGNVE